MENLKITFGHSAVRILSMFELKPFVGNTIR